MFIIEGADSLGKSTLAKSITTCMHERGHPVWYTHMTRPPACFNFGTDYLDMMSYYAVQDRFHLGALAYHGDEALPQSKRKWLEANIIRHASFIVVLVAVDREWYRMKLIEESRDQMFDVDFLMEANERYIRMIDIHNEEDTVHHDFVFDIGPDGDRDNGYPIDEDVLRWSQMWERKLVKAQREGILPWRE